MSLRPLPAAAAATLVWALAGSLGTGASAAELLAAESAHRLDCVGAVIDVGDPSFRWALGTGFHPRPSQTERSFAWADRRASILVPRAGGERSLRMTALGIEDGMTLRARWNGRELAPQRLDSIWQTVVWDLPPDGDAAGPALPGVLTLSTRVRRQRSRDARHLSFAVDRIWAAPGPACAHSGPAPPRPVRRPVELAPGAAWVVRLPLLPEAELRLAGRGGAGAELTWAVAAEEGPWAHGSVQADAGGRLAWRGAVGACCSERGTAWLVNRGAAPVVLETVAVDADGSPAAWRRACGSRWLLAAAVAGGLGLLWWLSGRRRTGRRAEPWLDAALVAALAAALRFVYLEAFPVSEITGFADSHGYLNGARMLLSDEYALWTDTQWHAWFSWIRPPGYYLVVAGVLGPLGAGVVALAAIQAVLSSLGAAALYSAGRSLFGRGVGLAAGMWLAIDPQAVTSASWVMTETLFLALLLPGVAALAACSARPRVVTAALAGVALGAAALVRSASLYYVPLAALLLVIVHWRDRRRRAAIAAAVLVAATALTVAPWSLRNQALYGTWVGIDDIALHNFLVDHPNEEVVPLAGDDLDTLEGKTRYRRRVAWANNDRGLTGRRGELMRQGLARMARRPGAEARRFAAMLERSWSPAPIGYVGMVVGENHSCRVARLTDLRNASIFATLILGGIGMLLALRRRESWPLMLWPPFTLIAINLLFHPELRYTFTYLPVVLIFAAYALARMRPNPPRPATPPEEA